MPNRRPSIRAVRRSTLSNRPRIPSNSDRITTGIRKKRSRQRQPTMDGHRKSGKDHVSPGRKTGNQTFMEFVEVSGAMFVRDGARTVVHAQRAQATRGWILHSVSGCWANVREGKCGSDRTRMEVDSTFTARRILRAMVPAEGARCTRCPRMLPQRANGRPHGNRRFCDPCRRRRDVERPWAWRSTGLADP